MATPFTGRLRTSTPSFLRKRPDTLPIEDPRFLGGVGVPAEEREDPWNWEGWTVALVRLAIGKIANVHKLDPEVLRARALKGREKTQETFRVEIQRLEAKAAPLEDKVQEETDRLRARRMLPDDQVLNKVTRYEAHLSRQMQQALHTLERLQRSRAGESCPHRQFSTVTVEAEPKLLTDGTTAEA